MEPDEKTISGSPLQEIVSLMDEEEVVLYWKESNSWKYIRELAYDSSDESKDILAYYRSVHCFAFSALTPLVGHWEAHLAGKKLSNVVLAWFPVWS